MEYIFLMIYVYIGILVAEFIFQSDAFLDTQEHYPIYALYAIGWPIVVIYCIIKSIIRFIKEVK